MSTSTHPTAWLLAHTYSAATLAPASSPSDTKVSGKQRRGSGCCCADLCSPKPSSPHVNPTCRKDTFEVELAKV
jgi:hypothetical protein